MTASGGTVMVAPASYNFCYGLAADSGAAMTRVNAARSLFVTIGIFSLLHCASNEPRLPEESVVEDGHFDFRGLFDQEADVVCEGFKTPVEGDGYCSEDVPDSWQSFEYDGEVYYFSPLASND